MIQFLLNNQTIQTDLPAGTTVLDFVRYHQHLMGTKIGCREGDCGACTVLVGELKGETVRYRSLTSCLTPLANVIGKHVVTIEGINTEGGGLSPVQSAMVEESGTQCGFCTVGFVMSLTGLAIDNQYVTQEETIGAIDGNICRCTGYKSIERAAQRLTDLLQTRDLHGSALDFAIQQGIVPAYFSTIKTRLVALETLPNLATSVKLNTAISVGGGTDLYVQKHDEMPYLAANYLVQAPNHQSPITLNSYRFIISGAATVSDLRESPELNGAFSFWQKHIKLVSSTPIRNIATVAGNLVNASPIGDLTIWFLALNARIFLENTEGVVRHLFLKDFYKGYKTLDKTVDEILTKIEFDTPAPQESFSTIFHHFNFEKVCKRQFLDIASVNTAILLKTNDLNEIVEAHVAMGGVSPMPLYLTNTSAFLIGKKIENAANLDWFEAANAVLQAEISPISDVRGSAEYKRLLARQLFLAHFVELF
jgi:xanthine dehydrogenase small subunit